MAVKNEKSEYTMYRGRPLVRSGRTIYYGDPGQDYVVLMNIVSTTKDGDDDMADKIVVQCMATDPTINPKDRIVKRARTRWSLPGSADCHPSGWIATTDCITKAPLVFQRGFLLGMACIIGQSKAYEGMIDLVHSRIIKAAHLFSRRRCLSMVPSAPAVQLNPWKGHTHLKADRCV